MVGCLFLIFLPFPCGPVQNRNFILYILYTEFWKVFFFFFLHMCAHVLIIWTLHIIWLLGVLWSFRVTFFLEKKTPTFTFIKPAENTFLWESYFSLIVYFARYRNLFKHKQGSKHNYWWRAVELLEKLLRLYYSYHTSGLTFWYVS